MFEIIIRNLKENKEDMIKADGYALIARNEDDATPDKVQIEETTIDAISNGIAANGNMRAAARLAVAKFDGMKDVRQEEEDKKMEKLRGFLRNMGKEE